jgi:two-component system response regulator AtoC
MTKRTRLVLRTLLKRQGYEVETADSGEAALALVDTFGPDVILTDVRMPKMGGLDLLATLQAKGNEATVILMSAYGNVDLALEAIKAGAYDYVQKPFKHEEIVLTLRKAEERETLRRENRALREEIRKEHQFEQILAKSQAMQEIFRTIAKIADYKTTVLISGESGTGKELVARALHPAKLAARRLVRRGELWRHSGEPARASSSGTRRARSPTPTTIVAVSSKKRMEGRSFSTRSVSCRSRFG